MSSKVEVEFDEAYSGECSSVDNFKIKIGDDHVLGGCGCCGSPYIGSETYPASELIVVIQKALQEYVAAKEGV